MVLLVRPSMVDGTHTAQDHKTPAALIDRLLAIVLG